MQQPGSPEARYQLVLTGSGSELFGIDGRGYVYLNVDDLDADPPRPLTYDLVVGQACVRACVIVITDCCA